MVNLVPYVGAVLESAVGHGWKIVTRGGVGDGIDSKRKDRKSKKKYKNFWNVCTL